MESVNRTLKGVLHIITVLQDICDKRRMQMEMQFSQEYHIFLREWKQKQKSSMKLCPKESNTNQMKKETEVKSLVEEMEEIALVDSLLQKARSIRMKSKEPSKPFHDSCKIPESHNSLPKPSAFESQQKKELYISAQINYTKALPRSKSALPTTRFKTVVVPRSKSANVHLVPKEEKPQNNRITTKMYSKKNTSSILSKQNQCKICDEPNSAIISNKELKDFKKSYVIYNICDKKMEKIENVSEILTSDFSQDSYPNSSPSCRGFLCELKQVSSLKSLFQLHRGGFWYPFLSSKHRNFLLCQRNLTTLDRLTKAFELMHKIQETMVWIDLLALIGRDALSSVVLLDGSDLNVIRLCYCLKSLYCKNLQRLPLLDPN